MAPTVKNPAGEHGPVEVKGMEFNAKEYLERTLHREPGDMMKIFPMQHRESFRVNWYSSAAAQGAMPGLNTVYIRDSKFLRCGLNAEGKPEITYPEKQ